MLDSNKASQINDVPNPYKNIKTKCTYHFIWFISQLQFFSFVFLAKLMEDDITTVYKKE